MIRFQSEEIKDGKVRSVVINVNNVPLKALARCIKRIPNTTVSKFSFDPINDNCDMEIKFKGIKIVLYTPFSDYILECDTPGNVFEEFIENIRLYKVRWWERFFS